MSTQIARGGKSFLQSRTLTSQDINSFIDLVFRTDSIVKLTPESSTGFGSGVYTSVVSIGGNAISLAVTGSQTATIAELTSKINTQVSAYATAVFIEAEQRIRIIANASGNVAVAVSTVGTLPGAILGSKQVGIRASWGTPLAGGGVNFELSNVASSTNLITAGYQVQATSAAGADIATTRTYNSSTGILQVKKASGSFIATDIVTVVGNLFG